MRFEHKHGIQLAIALCVCGFTTNGRCDEMLPTSIPPLLTASNVFTESPTTNTLPNVVTASGSSVAEWRDNVIDQCEDSAPFRMRRSASNRRRPFQRTHQLLQTKCYEINDWFGYIRGRGPAIWIHD